jgi:hypothetical protein
MLSLYHSHLLALSGKIQTHKENKNKKTLRDKFVLELVV